MGVRLQRLLAPALVAVILLTSAGPMRAQEPPDAEILRLMANMPTPVKVGQLFLVTFPGATADEESAIAELIRDYYVGGTVLSADNGNIINQGDTPRQVAELTSRLQMLAWEVAQQPITVEQTSALPPFIPLLVAVNHEGDGFPFTHIVNGMTPIPNPMAVGATWNTAHAETLGRIAGQELHAVGVNLLLGPSLDVLDTPRPKGSADLGTRTFGGDPFWVGEMGRAYIRGLHLGGLGHVAAVAKHFPGLGAADRPLTEEVATVQKSLEQLKQIELAPFIAVAQTTDGFLPQTDGLLVTHIRYQGFQGNIRAFTKPISFDAQALKQLMALPELAAWREGGGVMISDGLGQRAVKRFYDPTGQSFNGRRIAQEAFLAGNDLLLLSEFSLHEDWDERRANVKSTIEFFQEKYDTDPTFRARVDEAVARILRLKLRLYPDFTLEAVSADPELASEPVGQSREQVFGIAREAVTLLSPPSPDLLPGPPDPEEYIVIFTDDREALPCPGCEPVSFVDPRAIEDGLLRLYGPQGTGQVRPGHVTSFTFSQLLDYLSAPPAPPPAEGATPIPPHPVAAALNRATWVIFGMLKPDPQVPQSDAVGRFLAERADMLRGKQVVVLALNAPYYLDTTEISKLSAYLGVYSKVDPFIETAVQALFGGLPFAGASPVSVPGINYNLILQTAPNPNQAIEIYIGEPTGKGTPTPEAPEVRVGDMLLLRTSVIRDRNGNPVPDGTPVKFTLSYPLEGLEQSLGVTTEDGVARTMLTLDRVGQLEISAQSDPVPPTFRLRLTIQEGEPAIIETIPPTPAPTPTATATPTPGPQPTPELTPTPGTGEEPGGQQPPRRRVGPLDLLLALMGVLVTGGAGYWAMWNGGRSVARGLRCALWSIISGLTGYVVYALGAPGADWLRARTGSWGSWWVALVLGGIPLVVAWAASLVQTEGGARANQEPGA